MIRQPLAVSVGIMKFLRFLGPLAVCVCPWINAQEPLLPNRSVFPADNAWNRDVSKEPVDPNSVAILAAIGKDTPLHPDFGTIYKGAPSGIPFVVVSGSQPKVAVEFEYADESDPGPYPIPPNAPIEGGPTGKGDRHVIVIDRDNWLLYELFSSRPIANGERWKASAGAIFDLKSNKQRTAGWTSADAAGLPIFPGLVRYDEVMEKGMIAHALRFTCVRTRRAYVPPATHFASKLQDPLLPPMGMRVRLRADYDITDFPKPAQVILTCLKTHGMFLADNGGDFFISGVPDPRWNDEELRALKRVRGSDLEVVKMPPPVTK